MRARGLLACGALACACSVYGEDLLGDSGSGVDVGGSAGASAAGKGTAQAGSAGASSSGGGGTGGSLGEVAGQPPVTGDAGAGGGGVIVTPPGTISYRRWNDVPGWSTSAIPLTLTPDEETALDIFRDPGGADNYGAQLAGYLLPPLDGAYHFSIACHSNCTLAVSTGEDEADLLVISRITGEFNSSGVDIWDKYPAMQLSDAVTLSAGKRYRIEAQLKQAVGGAHLSVGWQKPGDAAGTFEVIPGAQLAPLAP